MTENVSAGARSAEGTIPSFFACPTCRAALDRAGDRVSCANGHEFNVLGEGVIDFLSGEHDEELPGDGEQVEHALAAVEHEGMERRVVNYIVPWIEAKAGTLAGVRLLEDGCGVGTTVDALVSRGVDAWGIDPSRTGRAQSWRKLSSPGRMHIADGTRLPFADESFDLVTSSGVLEHVGEPRPLSERDPHQQAYLTEIIRVLKPGGAALIAHPNGAHPLDYWHPRQWSIRPHLPYERWMPVASRVRRWATASPHPVEVRFLPPGNYLAFNRIKAHWYGRAFAAPMKLLTDSFARFPRLATSPLNPWLIAEVVKL
jgi:SAM-dependent methyltransferase